MLFYKRIVYAFKDGMDLCYWTSDFPLPIHAFSAK